MRIFLDSFLHLKWYWIKELLMVFYVLVVYSRFNMQEIAMDWRKTKRNSSRVFSVFQMSGDFSGTIFGQKYQKAEKNICFMKHNTVLEEIWWCDHLYKSYGFSSMLEKWLTKPCFISIYDISECVVMRSKYFKNYVKIC